MNLKQRVYFLPPFVVALLLHNVIHEGLHYLACQLFGEGVLEFRFLTNGWGTSQVIYATPTAERTGAHWLFIAWGPAVVTTLIGYLFYLNRERWLTRWPLMNAGLWYAGFCFLLFDPLYFAVLSLVVGGDVNAAAAMGWSPWPVRVVALAVFLLNAWLMVRWQREARAHPERYAIGGEA